jgi:DNA-binding CsgD family transcriptional regulator
MRIPFDSKPFRSRELLIGIASAVALLLMVALGVNHWLAILLSIVIYVGLQLLMTRSKQEDKPDRKPEPEPNPRPDVPPIDTSEPAVGKWIVDRTVADRFGLTTREREILPHLAERRTDREIAECLSISERTVNNHVSSILGKLGLETRRDVATFCIKEGLLLPPLLPSESPPMLPSDPE